MTSNEAILQEIKNNYKCITDGQYDPEGYDNINKSITSGWKEIADMGDTFVYYTESLDGNKYMKINECGICDIYKHK